MKMRNDWEKLIVAPDPTKNFKEQFLLSVNLVSNSTTYSTAKSNDITNRLIPLYCIILSLIIITTSIYVVYKFINQRSKNMLTKKLKFNNYDLEATKPIPITGIEQPVNKENQKLLNISNPQIDNLISFLSPVLLVGLIEKIKDKNDIKDPKIVIINWLNKPGNSFPLLVEIIRNLCVENNYNVEFISSLLQQECDRRNYV